VKWFQPNRGDIAPAMIARLTLVKLLRDCSGPPGPADVNFCFPATDLRLPFDEFDRRYLEGACAALSRNEPHPAPLADDFVERARERYHGVELVLCSRFNDATHQIEVAIHIKPD
jgi:hypothetical protein